MGIAYRDDREAALAQIESLQRENEALRRQLQGVSAPLPGTSSPALQQQFALLLLGGTMLFVASMLSIATMVHRVEFERASSELYDPVCTVPTPVPPSFARDGYPLGAYGVPVRRLADPVAPSADVPANVGFVPFAGSYQAVEIPTGFDPVIEMPLDVDNP